jgi:hypothetical protein
MSFHADSFEQRCRNCLLVWLKISTVSASRKPVMLINTSSDNSWSSIVAWLLTDNGYWRGRGRKIGRKKGKGNVTKEQSQLLINQSCFECENQRALVLEQTHFYNEKYVVSKKHFDIINKVEEEMRRFVRKNAFFK